MKIPVSKVFPNPNQPRTVFDADELASLAQSIVENDLVQPIVVEQDGDGNYFLIDGERRWRAHQLAGLKEIEAVVREKKAASGTERLTQALVANVQRAAMGFIDEAEAYRNLVEKLGGLDAVAQRTGVSKATIQARLSLLELAPEVQKLYNLKKLPFDLSVIATFKRLTMEDQARLGLMAVSRGWRTESILRSGRVMFSGRKKRTIITAPRRRRDEPAGKFDALAMLEARGYGKKARALPTVTRQAARATCRDCPLYAEASMVMCRECPLPDFLKRLGD